MNYSISIDSIFFIDWSFHPYWSLIYKLKNTGCLGNKLKVKKNIKKSAKHFCNSPIGTQKEK